MTNEKKPNLSIIDGGKKSTETPSENGAAPVTQGQQPDPETLEQLLSEMSAPIVGYMVASGVAEPVAIACARRALIEENQLGPLYMERLNLKTHAVWGIKILRPNPNDASKPLVMEEFRALKTFDTAANTGQEMGTVMMLALLSSPLARAFLYSRGYGLAWVGERGGATPNDAPRIIM